MERKRNILFYMLRNKSFKLNPQQKEKALTLVTNMSTHEDYTSTMLWILETEESNSKVYA